MFSCLAPGDGLPHPATQKRGSAIKSPINAKVRWRLLSILLVLQQCVTVRLRTGFGCRFRTVPQSLLVDPRMWPLRICESAGPARGGCRSALALAVTHLSTLSSSLRLWEPGDPRVTPSDSVIPAPTEHPCPWPSHAALTKATRYPRQSPRQHRPPAEGPCHPGTQIEPSSYGITAMPGLSSAFSTAQSTCFLPPACGALPSGGRLYYIPISDSDPTGCSLQAPAS